MHCVHGLVSMEDVHVLHMSTCTFVHSNYSFVNAVQSHVHVPVHVDICIIADTSKNNSLTLTQP